MSAWCGDGVSPSFGEYPLFHALWIWYLFLVSGCLYPPQGYVSFDDFLSGRSLLDRRIAREVGMLSKLRKVLSKTYCLEKEGDDERH